MMHLSHIHHYFHFHHSPCWTRFMGGLSLVLSGKKFSVKSAKAGAILVFRSQTIVSTSVLFECTIPVCSFALFWLEDWPAGYSRWQTCEREKDIQTPASPVGLRLFSAFPLSWPIWQTGHYKRQNDMVHEDINHHFYLSGLVVRMKGRGGVHDRTTLQHQYSWRKVSQAAGRRQAVQVGSLSGCAG